MMSEYTEVKDSGVRELQGDGGAVRDSREGKGRFDLLPGTVFSHMYMVGLSVRPSAMRRLAKHFENGARKYSARNWEKGMNISRYIDSCQRHINNYLTGDRSEDHLAAAMWNAVCAYHTDLMVSRGVLDKSYDDMSELNYGEPGVGFDGYCGEVQTGVYESVSDINRANCCIDLFKQQINIYGNRNVDGPKTRSRIWLLYAVSELSKVLDAEEKNQKQNM